MTFILDCLICTLIWFTILALVGFISWLKDRKRRIVIRDGREMFDNQNARINALVDTSKGPDTELKGEEK